MTFEILDSKSARIWDDFVSSSPHGHFMQSRAWGTFQKTIGWEPHYTIVSHNDKIKAAALLLSKRVTPTGHKIYYAPRGPVTDFTNHGATDLLTNGLSEYLRQGNGVFLRFDPYICNGEQLRPPLLPVPRDWSYWNAPKLVLWLDLTGDKDAVMSRMTSTCRNEVRRGYKNNVEFSMSCEDDAICEFYRLMVETGQHKGIAVHTLDYYKKLFSTISASAKLQLFLGRHEGKVITAGVSIIYGQKAWLLYAASTPASYKLRANRTLQWEMIQWAHNQGCYRYDFRGTATSDPPSTNDPGYGVYEFKKSFGAEFTRLAGYFDLINRPGFYRGFRFVEEKLLPVVYRAKTWIQK